MSAILDGGVSAGEPPDEAVDDGDKEGAVCREAGSWEGGGALNLARCSSLAASSLRFMLDSCRAARSALMFFLAK